ncbi:hsp70 family protein [Gigaspora margarita]|uniref:Hsp70 family protein n=1 Tax=Gigaspora margarita TaxID=4874 RepID=A0A8H4ABG0_GIGMA|nr:hsp70 family protein [Gigaspora margarita]
MASNIIKFLSSFKEDKDEEKTFEFEIDKAILIKQFKPNIELGDVRKKLAENRDNWKAEKLRFKLDGKWIYHEDESDYTLNKLKSDKSVIYIENLLKKTKIHVNGKVFIYSLDPEDNLEDIRKVLSEGKHAEIFANDFKFRWNDGSIVDQDEEISNNLEEILVNGNELYIIIFQKDEIIIYNRHSDEPFGLILDKGANLSDIRNMLENICVEQSHLYMCSKCYFLNQNKVRIFKSEENNVMLGKILLIEDSGDVLNIGCEHEHDLIKLIGKCEYGFMIKNGKVEQAEYRAFKFKKTPDHRILNCKYEENSLECKNEFYDLCERNFITFGNATSILPWVSVFFGINYKDSLKKLEDYKETIKYSYLKLRRANVNILKDNVSVSKEFTDEVEKALKETTEDKKVENLKKIAEKYGYFYASTVYFGGVIVQKIEDIKYSNELIESEELDTTANIGPKNAETSVGATMKIGKNTKTVIDNTKSSYIMKGGDISQFKFNDRSEWINSLKDSEKWDIIEHYNIHSIFSLLEVDLQKKVIVALGKRILKVKVDSFEYRENENNVYELSRYLGNITNIEDCHIFTTILKDNKDRHIFSSYITYDYYDKPIIIIKRAPSKKKPRKKVTNIQIGWMVIGYPTDTFDFKLSNQFIIESQEQKLNDQFIVPNISYQSNSKYVLTTCVLDNREKIISSQETGTTLEMKMISPQEETSLISTTETTSSQEEISSASTMKMTSSQEEISSASTMETTSSQGKIYLTSAIIGSYISYLPNSAHLSAAHLFVYCSETYKKQIDRNKQNDQYLRLKLFLCTIDIKQDSLNKYFKQGEVEWCNRGLTKKSSVWHSKIKLDQNNTDKSLINHLFSKSYPNNMNLTKTSSVWYPNIVRSPIFINQYFSETCTKNNCHGIINVSPRHFQLRILNNNEFTAKSEISYFRIPPEINVIYS